MELIICFKRDLTVVWERPWCDNVDLVKKEAFFPEKKMLGADF
jgi:hypothetical protein